MRVIVVDPDPLELIRLSDNIHIAFPSASVECFKDPLLAFKFGMYNQVDGLYALAEMQRMSGLDMGRRLRDKYPKIRVNVFWHNDDYREQAKEAEADVYLKKPITPDMLIDAEKVNKATLLDSLRERIPRYP